MSLKARISKIEEKLPKEDMSLLELSYHGAKPTEEEMEIALKHTDGCDPPWTVMYVPYDFKHELESAQITGRWVITLDDKLGLYYDGKTVFKLIEKYDKERIYVSKMDRVEILEDQMVYCTSEEYETIMSQLRTAIHDIERKSPPKEQ